MGKKFFWKSFVSFSLFWAFFILLISGLVLYVSPPGRVANWTNWTLLGFSKSGWQAIHIIFSYTFVILSVFHLFFLNWRAFWSYVTTKAFKGVNKKMELVYSVILILVIFFGTVYRIQPLKAVLDFGEWMTESWEVQKEEPPIPHAEILTIRELSEKYIQLPADRILEIIKQKGFSADSIGQSLAEIGEINHVTPASLYQLISGSKVESGSVSEKPRMQGMGRKTLKEVSDELGKDVNEVIALLEKNGIKAAPDDQLKTIADNSGKQPIEIIELIEQ